MILDNLDPTPVDWKHKLLEQAKALGLLQEKTQQMRNREVFDWMETQPPEIKDTSIGK